MVVKLPKEIIESDIKLESSLPEMKVCSHKNEDGSMSITYGYDVSAIDSYIKIMAREMNEKIESALIDELMTMNGHVKERTCRIDRRVPDAPFCSECAYDWDDDWNYCPNCGAKALND